MSLTARRSEDPSQRPEGRTGTSWASRAALAAAVLLLSALPAKALEVVIDNGLGPPNPANFIEADDSFPVPLTVQNAASGQPTRVEILHGGTTAELTVLGYSEVRVVGGTIDGDVVVADRLAGGGQLPVMTVEYGQVNGGVTVDAAGMLIMRGGSLSGQLEAVYAGYVMLRGGSLQQHLSARDYATIVVAGASVAGDAVAGDDAILVVTGGAISGALRAEGSAAVEWRGGSVALGLSATESSSLRIIGESFTVDGAPVGFGPLTASSGMLAGVLASGASIDVGFARGSEAAIVLEPEGAPEAPVTHERQKLLASDGQAGPGDFASFSVLFGTGADIEGDMAIVGAPGGTGNAEDSGAAYVFRRNGDEWVEEAKLVASDGVEYQHFGFDLAISGDTAVISAPCRGYNLSCYISPQRDGSAYVYRYDGSDWIEEATLTPPAGVRDFGQSVALSGDTVALGVPLHDGQAGSVFVFRYDGAGWTQQAEITASDREPRDGFGNDLSLSNDVMLVGARNDGDNGENSGSAYVFRYDGAAWVEEAKLTASDGEAEDSFSSAVALSGDVAVVGSSHDDDHGFNSGAAYVYRFDGAAWLEEAKLTAPDGARTDYFGSRIDVSGDTVIVGSANDDTRPFGASGFGWGSAHVFRHDGTAWTAESKLVASDGAPADYLAVAVALSGDDVLLGANYQDDNGREAGAAYVFSLPQPSAAALHLMALGTLAALAARRSALTRRL